MSAETEKKHDLWEAGRHIAALVNHHREAAVLAQRYREEGREDWTEEECLLLALGALALRQVLKRDPGYGYTEFAYDPGRR
ncbi:hypothetical protein EDD27_3596 [Nonomuraea polychroma]|uniref:Uncharacterized protein n=1 Tax=Nonomuraea polychroma TaxID=46176 RepID=A0A438M649_9ACTN|nr:hypothetical protein [Nonomuraea polychroma]RVX41127.1 hypothetical protein EDD27_3596 [Nonomuraea polychroma]